jgi:hypothetical protein
VPRQVARVNAGRPTSSGDTRRADGSTGSSPTDGERGRVIGSSGFCFSATGSDGRNPTARARVGKDWCTRCRDVRACGDLKRNRREPGEIMNLALWVAAGLLAAIALTGGISKTFVPKKKLSDTHGGEWTEDVSGGFVKTLGGLEILAAAGLILPALTGVVPVMVPVTAVCWVLLMVGAMITHGRLNQYKLVMLNVAYLALALFIAWGRFGPVQFTA